jgi:imidazolonepropionase-like amidohydrolase
MRTRLACLLALVALQPSFAQQAPPTPQRVVIRAARMLDVESGRIIPDARIVVEGDRIQAINPATLPAGVRVIDLGDLTLAPGFIDTHTHLGGEIGPNMLLEPVTTTEVDAAFNAVKNGHKTLMAGFRRLGYRRFGEGG